MKFLIVSELSSFQTLSVVGLLRALQPHRASHQIPQKLPATSRPAQSQTSSAVTCCMQVSVAQSTLIYAMRVVDGQLV